MRDFVLQLIENKQKRYREDYSEMLGDYKRELETIKGYNGRQLLELLQNCDDEGATKVTIALDKDARTISISNNGNTSFSKKGYRSLFIANLSSKTSRKYIGNKGLGFRSIINWSKSIEIQSNNLSLFYSEQNTKENYEKLFSKEERQRIVEEENLGENTIPVPFLSMPILKNINQGDFKTAIIIQFKKKVFKNIFKQVKNITPETLLFLKHIEEVHFKGFEDVANIKCKRETHLHKTAEFSPREFIQFSANSWSIFEVEKELPSKFQDSNKTEKQFYQIKIAVEDNFEKSSPNLYSFFPTNIKLNQPYVLHATFDLDATRNQLNESEKNRYILEKVVAFTIEVAKYYSQSKVSYQPLSILNHTHKADTLDNLGYYDLIEEAINNEAIFPCIDNEYRKLEEVIYINDEFAEFLQDANAEDIISIHLLPLEELTLENFNLEDEIYGSLQNLEDYLFHLNQISNKELSIKQRAQWIRLITQEASFIKNHHENGCNFLINNNGELINGDEYIYTPITKEKKLKTPIFTNIQFINDNLFEALLTELKFNTRDNPNKSRFIYDELKGFCNIHSYEPATLAQKIIRETNAVIEKDTDQSIVCIKEMNQCLYHNFKLMNDGTKIPDDSVKIPCISKSGTKAYTEDLVLSDFYPLGKRTTLIFEGVLPEKTFVAKPTDLGFNEAENIHELERYLKWIKVNSYARYKNKSVVDNGIEDYFKHVKLYDGFDRYTGYRIDYLAINGFKSILEKIAIEKLILWIYYDDVLKQQLYDYNNDDRFRYFYYDYNIITNKPSYLKYLIKKFYKYDFSEFLIDEKYSWVNNFKINYKKIMDLDENINKTIINEILVSLGANDDFNDLPIEKVAEIINKLPDNYPTGAKSQTFYKKALSHFNHNEIEIEVPLKLFAHDGNELQLYNQNDVYFSEKIKLPNKLKKDFPIFNYPARAGGAEAIKFFGINDLKEVKIEVKDKMLLTSITERFEDVLFKLKPFLLSHRLNVIEDVEVRKVQASICQKIKILLCSSVEYKVKEGVYEVADYEFLHLEEQTYLIKINDFDTINSLKKNVDFTNSFSDIISLAFDITSDKNEYKYILRSDFEDVQNSIKSDLGEDTLNEAREFLGLADYKQAFWQAVFQVRGLEYNDLLDDLALEKTIKGSLGIEFDTNSLDYEKINLENELVKIEQLFDELDITLENFANYYSYKISIAQYHLSKIKDAILSKKNVIKSSIWLNFKEKTIDEKAKFLAEINRYEDYKEFAQQKAEEFKHQFNIDKTIVFKDYLNLVYPNLTLIDNVNLDEIKRKHKEKFTENELYKIRQSERLNSLLYFEDALEIIKEELNKDIELEIEVSSDNGRNDNDVVLQTRLFSSDVLKTKSPTNGNNRHSVYTPKEKNNKGLKLKGNNSEQIVYDFLIENGYKNVDLVSDDNEGLQCDIRYTNEKEEVKYVEVKTFDNGKFFLSKYEYDFGKNNEKDYEVWLVKNKQDIIPIYDFFSNPKYITSVNEYLVHLEIV
ncbi:sacsin N-terminal ATP-binding-like domain-containing protein [Mesoflavibacter sp. SCSIO 43206]|uniref:sacsin N-terminal ATP-binding-like domain-containing protein n=1 Tax=Mesoflavibacter sp. SCSIO 43206 TaxID=2779362 RepID=UPI001CA9AC90|nr:DUF3883 domain-containing protein [Mesoflavibacter sp. SCSIO 43206]UAB74328.1 DUF3883 domain-containing protein [Mesoflavibacter sp. SCSIO 43206]